MASDRAIVVGDGVPIESEEREPETDAEIASRRDAEAFERGRQAALDELRALGRLDAPESTYGQASYYGTASVWTGYMSSAYFSRVTGGDPFSTIYNTDGTVRRRRNG